MRRVFMMALSVVTILAVFAQPALAAVSNMR